MAKDLPFDPMNDLVSEARWREAFPDTETLIAADEREHGRADEYRVAKVPDHPVFVLFGLIEATRTIRLLSIRTHHGPMN